MEITLGWMIQGNGHFYNGEIKTEGQDGSLGPDGESCQVGLRGRVKFSVSTEGVANARKFKFFH